MTKTEEAVGVLARLEKRADEARVVLRGLLQDIQDAENHLGGTEVAQLLAANEQLVLSALRAQTDAETAAMALDDVARSAELDHLTGLPNRLVMLDRISQAIALAKRNHTRLALLFLDLDNFKLINDTLGHAVGDQALQLAARLLVSSVRAADTVSRHGGDEFVILLAEVGQASDAELIADKVIAAMAVHSRIDEHPICLSASVGISIYPDNGEEAEALIDCADKAMYSAKKQGLGRVLFRDEDHAQNPAPKAAITGFEPMHAGSGRENERIALGAVTAQALQAEAQKACRRQTEWLVRVARALQSPMGTIRVAADLLGQEPQDETQRLRIKTVIELQLVQMEHLVRDLLNVSRVHPGMLQFERLVVPIVDIVDPVLQACKAAMDARGQQFTLILSSSPIEIECDPVRLAQALIQLLEAASNQTPEGGAIALSVVAAHGDLVWTVSGSGLDISELPSPDVLAPFMQGIAAINVDGVDVGKQLAIARESVEAHGGYLVATSAGVESGVQFIVMLPAKSVDPVCEPAIEPGN